MNNYKIKIGLLLISFISVSSCQSQESKFVDLEKVSSNFNVSAFFKNKIKKTNETLATDPKSVDKETALKLIDNPFFVKDTLGYYKTEGRFPTDLSLESTNDWMTRKKTPTEIFGYEYRTVAYNQERDTLAILNTVVFPKINMTEDEKGTFMYLSAEKTSKNPVDYEKIKSYLEKSCKKVSLKEEETDETYWENESSLFKLTKKLNKEEEILGFDLKGNKNSKWVNVTEINLSIYQKSYIEKMEKLKIYSPGRIFWKTAQ